MVRALLTGGHFFTLTRQRKGDIIYTDRSIAVSLKNPKKLWQPLKIF